MLRMFGAFLLALTLAGAAVYAQSPFPCGVQLPNGDWVPCDHPLAYRDVGILMKPGHRYWAAYGFEMVTLGSLRSVTSGKWIVIGEFTKSGGSPPVGQLVQFEVERKYSGWIDLGPVQY